MKMKKLSSYLISCYLKYSNLSLGNKFKKNENIKDTY